MIWLLAIFLLAFGSSRLQKKRQPSEVIILMPLVQSFQVNVRIVIEQSKPAIVSQEQEKAKRRLMP